MSHTPSLLSTRPFLISSLLLALPLLLLTGCDQSLTTDDWEGDWELTETIDGTPPNDNVYLTYTDEEFIVFRVDPFNDDCRIFGEEVVDVVDNKVTVLQSNGALRTEELTVADEVLTGTIVRSNTDADEGESYEARSLDADPRNLLDNEDCEKAKRSDSTRVQHPFR